MEIVIKCNVIGFENAISKKTGKQYSIYLLADGVNSLKVFGDVLLDVPVGQVCNCTCSLSATGSIFLKSIELAYKSTEV